MRWITCCVALLSVMIWFNVEVCAQDKRPPLHIEKGLREQLTIEEATHRMQIIHRADNKVLLETSYYTYHRYLIGSTLHGSQARKLDRHPLDDFQCLTAKHPWDNIAVLGALATFDMRQEPLTYHHRTGPIGAVYAELRTRKGGKDAKAPVAVLGMNAGEQACYALRGQEMTFYESDPAVKKLVADTDKYFSYIADARKRGAKIDIQVGSRRAKLKDDKDKKYALVVVDLAESFPIPTDVFTKEAVEEYFNRLTDDGFVMLHVSNKYIRLEPMVAKLAEELKLTGRVWHDDGEGKHGKTAASWVVLARSREALGERLCSPIGDLMVEYSPSDQLLEVIQDKYPEVKKAIDKPGPKQRETLLKWLDGRTDDATAAKFAAWVRKYQSEYVSLMALLQAETGHGFRPLRKMPHVTAWTDEQADVFILWMNADLQRIRKFFGYPTPLVP